MTYTFQEVVGIGGYGEEKTYARCKSIRRAVFVKNDDRKGQILGSMLGKYNILKLLFPCCASDLICAVLFLPDFNMNTLYIYILFCKFYTNEPTKHSTRCT